MVSLNETGHFLSLEWQTERIEQNDYLLKTLFESEQLAILLLDLSHFRLYHLKQDKATIEHLFKRLNPSLEAPTNKIIEHLKKNLNSTSSKLSVEFCSNDDREAATESSSQCLKLHMISHLSDVRFDWEFRFVPLDTRLIRDHFAYPLMFNIAELEAREHELFKRIQLKDKLINDFKEQGLVPTRKHLCTSEFHVASFDEEFANMKPQNCSETVVGSLQTPLMHKVNAHCSRKYYAEFFKTSSSSSGEAKLNGASKDDDTAGGEATKEVARDAKANRKETAQHKEKAKSSATTKTAPGTLIKTKGAKTFATVDQDDVENAEAVDLEKEGGRKEQAKEKAKEIDKEKEKEKSVAATNSNTNAKNNNKEVSPKKKKKLF